MKPQDLTLVYVHRDGETVTRTSRVWSAQRFLEARMKEATAEATKPEKDFKPFDIVEVRQK